MSRRPSYRQTTAAFARAVAIIAVVLVAACHTRTTFVDPDGQTYVGVVVGSDDRAIELMDRTGRTFSVSRERVEDVTWAGTPATIVGGSLVGAGVISLGVTVAMTAGNNEEEFTVFGAVASGVLTTIGLFPLIWGLATSSAARSKVARPAPASKMPRDTGPDGATLQIHPWAGPGAAGLHVDGRF